VTRNLDNLHPAARHGILAGIPAFTAPIAAALATAGGAPTPGALTAAVGAGAGVLAATHGLLRFTRLTTRYGAGNTSSDLVVPGDGNVYVDQAPKNPAT
jgi:hypothetical protein